MRKALHIDPSRIIEERWNNWPELHPEDYCHRCGSRNLYAWSVDSLLWNLAVQELGLTRSAILCPPCFYEGVERVVGSTYWTLVPGDGYLDIAKQAASVRHGDEEGA